MNTLQRMRRLITGAERSRGFIRRRRYLLYPGEAADVLAEARRGSDRATDQVGRFEAALARYLGADHVVLVNSGRVALLVLLEALGLKPGDEILVPAYTLRALLELLAASGYVPVPVDLAPGSYNLDPQEARRRRSPQTRALLATHLFGVPCDIAACQRVAQEEGLLLVEDCAQSLGATSGGQLLGTFGDGAILSFDLLKPINTFGGGAVVVRSPEVAARVTASVEQLADPGSAVAKRIAVAYLEHALLVAPTAPLVSAALAFPATKALVSRGYRSMQDTVRPTGARYSSTQARIGLRLLDSLDGRTAVRRGMVRRLATLLGERPGARLDENGYFFVRCARDHAEALRRRLLWRGIDAGIGSEVADYCGDVGRGADCPRARAVHERAVQLPLHEGLRDPDLVRIAAACRGEVTLPP